VVYYANYLRYFERARTAHLEMLGVDVVSLTRNGQFFVVTHAEVNYHLPARYGDVLIVESGIHKVGGASISFHHVVRSVDGSKRFATGQVHLASVDSSGHIVRLPRIVLNSLRTELPSGSR